MTGIRAWPSPARHWCADHRHVGRICRFRAGRSTHRATNGAPMFNTMPAGEADSNAPASTGGSTLGAFLTAAGSIAAEGSGRQQPAGRRPGRHPGAVGEDKLAPRAGAVHRQARGRAAGGRRLVQAAQRATGRMTRSMPCRPPGAARKPWQRSRPVVDTLDRPRPCSKAVRGDGPPGVAKTPSALRQTLTRATPTTRCCSTRLGSSCDSSMFFSLAFACFSGWFVTSNWQGPRPSSRAMVITLMIVAG